jgi:cation diffusion facilitator CzcD-associated flavoprotein CzcO
MAKQRIAIIGAGLGGLNAAIKLKEAGYSELRLFDRNNRVGGTWAENTYPGVACDTPVALYQFSFAPSFNWSRLYPSGQEIQAYAEELTDRYQLREHLHLADPVQSATWNAESKTWLVKTTSGYTMEADVVVGALGQLNRPQWPSIEGRECFKGASMHSARWDHSVSLQGKRVGVIGSAASAVQIIPEIAKMAEKVTVFQRTPNYLVQRFDRSVPPEELMLMATNMEKAMELAELNRRAIYETADYFFWQIFQWTPEGRAAYTRLSMDHMAAQIPDPALREKLTPKFPIGTKRVLICDDFYPALMRPNVELETDSIERISDNGVLTTAGKLHECDVLVYATGFETTAWRWSVDVIGAAGQHLNQVWAEAPEAYLGIGVAGFPNFFVLYGPNTNLSHNSITFMLERQVEYVVKALAALENTGARALMPTQSAQDGFNEKLQQDLAKTVWADPAAGSWYKNAKGRITQNWSSHTRDYAAVVADVKLDDYELIQ